MEKFSYFFENIKDLIRSAAKGMETVIRKEIDSLRDEIHLTQLALKATRDELKNDNSNLRAELKADISNFRDEFKADIPNLRTEMQAMEIRLTGKIDSINAHIIEHEARPVHLAHPNA